MKKVFLSFSNSRFVSSKKRLYDQVENLEVYDELKILDETYLSSNFRDLFRKYLQAKEGRGYGYYCWKPQVILQTFDELEYGDIIHYADTGCHLNLKGKKRLINYFDLVNESEIGILAFESGPPPEGFPSNGFMPINRYNFQYIKGDLLKYFSLDHDHTIVKNFVVTATTIFFKKTKLSEKFLKDWIDVFTTDFSLIDDTPSRNTNPVGFICHKHDQSIFSILARIYQINLLSDCEIWYPGNLESTRADWHLLENFPIHAKRDLKKK